MKFIVGKKLKMGQIWENKKVVPVTVVEAGPCFVTQVKTKEKDGYNAVQLGFDKLKEKKVGKANKSKPFATLKEYRAEGLTLNVGDTLDLSNANFAEGDIVSVSGISKGKGYQGGTKRFGFRGAASASHGNKHNHRTVGSIGSRWPQRVIKGKHMPGHMGYHRTTVHGLKIAKIDAANNLIAIKGAIPGGTGRVLEIVSKK